MFHFVAIMTLVVRACDTTISPNKDGGRLFGERHVLNYRDQKLSRRPAQRALAAVCDVDGERHSLDEQRSNEGTDVVAGRKTG